MEEARVSGVVRGVCGSVKWRHARDWGIWEDVFGWRRNIFGIGGSEEVILFI